MRTLLLDVGGGDNLGGEVQPLAEVVETLGSQGVVVVLPRELGLDETARVQGLKSLDDLFARQLAKWRLFVGLLPGRT